MAARVVMSDADMRRAVLRIAHELGGFSLADSDLLRRAMSHFDPGKQMQTLKLRFVAGAAANPSCEMIAPSLALSFNSASVLSSESVQEIFQTGVASTPSFFSS